MYLSSFSYLSLIKEFDYENIRFYSAFDINCHFYQRLFQTIL